jgi:hypothetical protein
MILFRKVVGVEIGFKEIIMVLMVLDGIDIC